jgi:hypothetical protein
MPVKKKHRPTKSAKEHLTFFNSKRRERKKKVQTAYSFAIATTKKN